MPSSFLYFQLPSSCFTQPAGSFSSGSCSLSSPGIVTAGVSFSEVPLCSCAAASSSEFCSELSVSSCCQVTAVPSFSAALTLAGSAQPPAATAAAISSAAIFFLPSVFPPFIAPSGKSHILPVRPACGCGTVLRCPAVLHPWKRARRSSSDGFRISSSCREVGMPSEWKNATVRSMPSVARL